MVFRVFVLFALFFSIVPIATSETDVLKVYSRPGCPHCAKAKVFLDKWKKENPKINVTIINVWENKSAFSEMKDFASDHNIERLSVPLFVYGENFMIGFPGDEKARERLGQMLMNQPEKLSEEIDLPLIGTINTKEMSVLGLTAAIGLIDGFNPCAMWVLLILLSLLVHMKDRRRMFAIAGIFVVVSGVVYFAFMASWLLVYDYLDWGRRMQLIVGWLALVIGLVHMKDFFAFKKGVSFSIPDRFKIKIATRAREIVQAKSLGIALALAVVLAIFVNFIELMCTAGLPAIYTRVLHDNGIEGIRRLSYLGLYSLFYMLDDGIMVLIATWTLSQKRLQETSGRWLKLISGLVLATLALSMIFFPDVLSF